jgi:Family of unknown function (DUF6155)
MSKPKLSDFKKLLAELSHEELKAEMLKLFQKLPQVQAFYAQDLSSPEERKKILDTYKKKIYNEFWTRGDNPKIANGTALKLIISDFEKVCVAQAELVELLLYRVDCCMEQANDFGGTSDSAYNTALTAFEKALKIIVKEKLEKEFEVECREVARDRGNMDCWPIDQMNDWLEEYLG